MDKDISFCIQFEIDEKGLPKSSPQIIWGGENIDGHRKSIYIGEEKLMSMAMSGADNLSLGSDNWHYAKDSDEVFSSGIKFIRQINYHFERGNGLRRKR
jgi:hypothetical protein